MKGDDICNQPISPKNFIKLQFATPARSERKIIPKIARASEKPIFSLQKLEQTRRSMLKYQNLWASLGNFSKKRGKKAHISVNFFQLKVFILFVLRCLRSSREQACHVGKKIVPQYKNYCYLVRKSSLPLTLPLTFTLLFPFPLPFPFPFLPSFNFPLLFSFPFHFSLFFPLFLTWFSSPLDFLPHQLEIIFLEPFSNMVLYHILHPIWISLPYTLGCVLHFLCSWRTQLGPGSSQNVDGSQGIALINRFHNIQRNFIVHLLYKLYAMHSERYRKVNIG